MAYNVMYMKRKQAMPAGRQGFTLVELMIVMIIMGILVTIGVTAFTSSMKKGRDSTRKANLRAITNALEMYYNDNGRYPAGDTNGAIVGCSSVLPITPTPCAINSAFKDANGTMYMQQLPTDPVSSQKYYYRAPATNQYQIYARLENLQDPLLTPAPASPPSCGSANCNWGLSSGNITP